MNLVINNCIGYSVVTKFKLSLNCNYSRFTQISTHIQRNMLIKSRIKTSGKPFCKTLHCRGRMCFRKFAGQPISARMRGELAKSSEYCVTVHLNIMVAISTFLDTHYTSLAIMSNRPKIER